ncbi:membrane protein insertase YidC [bacterium]|nr:membrane protein insertase YidC [bacterium]
MNTDDRRLLLAFVLSLLVFLAYQFYMVKAYPPLPPVPVSQDIDTSSAGAPRGAAGDAEIARPRVPTETAAVPPDSEELTLLSGNGFELTATTWGAGVRQIRLPGVPVRPHMDERDVTLVDESRPSPLAAVRLPGHAAPQAFRKIRSASRSVVYLFENELLRVERVIEVTEHPYESRLTTTIRNVSGKTLQYGLKSGLGVELAGLPPKSGKGSDLDVHAAYIKLGDDIEHVQEESPGFFSNFFGRKTAGGSRAESFTGQIRWISLGDRYFTTTWIPAEVVEEASLVMTGPAFSGLGAYGSFELTPGSSARYEEILYAGPKDPERLRGYGNDLLEIMNFGWFGWLGFWMLKLMNLFYRFIPNYGVAIILLTIIIRIVLYPLTYKSYVSMAKLKELAPKMKAIQEKYADNREKLNKEMMRMYKDHKVNPAGGCLPILLQIPVFIAFYHTLQYAIELRGAPFCLWIIDLSEKDPYYVLPVLMGISMLIQQKLTPTPDPNQAKIGMIMTVVFTFLFLMFPSGLVLYWLVSNVLGIWQQKVIEKKLKGEGEREKGR